MGNWWKRCSAITILIGIAVAGSLLPLRAVRAGETGTFEGTLTASGARQTLDFMEDRTVFTFTLEGHINLVNAVGETGDFWAKWIGLWDTQTGGSARCVWDDMNGQQIYVALTGTQLEKGATLTGELVGGTGAFKGIQGNFSFTWTSVSLNTGDDVMAGFAKNIKGTYQLP